MSEARCDKCEFCIKLVRSNKTTGYCCLMLFEQYLAEKDKYSVVSEPYIYETTPDGYCEMFTENKKYLH